MSLELSDCLAKHSLAGREASAVFPHSGSHMGSEILFSLLALNCSPVSQALPRGRDARSHHLCEQPLQATVVGAGDQAGFPSCFFPWACEDPGITRLFHVSRGGTCR